MSLIREFRDFAMRGNVVDMAVGIIIGAAFGEIVGSLVKDVMMPPLGYLMNNVDFSQMSIKLEPPALVEGAAVTPVEIKYGMFINALIKFTIVAFALFMIIKAMNKLKKKEEAAPPPGPSNEEKLLGEIRDLLKTRA